MTQKMSNGSMYRVSGECASDGSHGLSKGFFAKLGKSYKFHGDENGRTMLFYGLRVHLISTGSKNRRFPNERTNS